MFDELLADRTLVGSAAISAAETAVPRFRKHRRAATTIDTEKQTAYLWGDGKQAMAWTTHDDTARYERVRGETAPLNASSHTAKRYWRTRP